jgi:Dullard-like phosphatase family protein
MSKEILSAKKKSSTIISSIRQALTLNEDDKNTSLNLETSKVSIDSTSSDSSTNSKEKESNIIEPINDYYNSFDYFQFEQNFKNYYVDSSKNNNGNYDNYVKNALKLISLIPYQKLNISEKIREIQKNLKYDIPPVSTSIFNSNKKLLILDIDETLVHSDLDFSLNQNKTKYDAILHFDSEEEKNIPVPLIVRPGTKKFLDYAVQEFDLVVFTASEQQYADVVIDYLEKDKKYFKKRFYRNHCVFIEPGLYIKDLRIFSGIKKLEDIIILDNSLFSFANQLNNGILITSFFSDLNDSFLENVKCYLDYIKNEKDIRIVNKKSFRFEEIKDDIIRNDN